MAADHSIILDSRILWWVLLPIFAAMFLSGVLRNNITRISSLPSIKKKKDEVTCGLVTSSNCPLQLKPDAVAANMKKTREGQAIYRGQCLRSHLNFIPPNAFKVHRHNFTAKEGGVFNEPVEAANPQAAMINDPSKMQEMMMKNVTMLASNFVIGMWANFFFSGFVVAKVPFMLTSSFRSMLQRGVEAGSLDVTYISSLSWYFLNMFGLNGLYMLVLGENTLNDAALASQMMTQQMQSGMVDTKAIYKAEKDNIDMSQHEWILPHLELRALGFLQASLATTP